MKKLTTYVSAAALSLTLAALAAPANATTFIDIATSGLTGANQVVWDGTAPGAGTFTVSGISTVLNFEDSLFNDGLLGQMAVLTIHGTTTGGLSVALPNFTQQGIDGFFEFRQASNPSVVLLRGDFTNFWLTGINGDKSGNLTSVGGQLNLTSAVADLSKVTQDNAIFGFTNVKNPFGITAGQLNDFTAGNLTGSFGGAIPEPASWALMIMGFGGIGAMVRRRKTSAALA